jgi:hypothetical protein
LPTIDTVLAGRDLSTPFPLLGLKDGRRVAMAENELPAGVL